ncbi:transposase-like protein [Streptomyces calvus]|uniref:Transposase-like protein n=1 Tax=Streptomyces calvus TaxID=67282 RepID=A0AA40SL87_9ACTN|nr:helix-turn-helix domain-containing protein [Streptomyces calvus]MBA8948376.1 transposase-like protein [Streptomyces calvus]
MSIREASRVVGINRRTGQEWLNGRAERVTAKAGRSKSIRAAVQPLVGAPRTFPLNPRKGGLRAPALAISTRYLSEEERIRIADLRRAKKSIRSIAAALGRSPSTISREIRRNCNPNVGPAHPSYYRPFAAQ